MSGDYERIAAETGDGMSNTWDDIMICQVGPGGAEGIVGRSVARIAAERGRRAACVALDLLREYSGDVQIISINNNEDNLKSVLTHALTMIITDGLVMEGISHPRTFGTYPKFLGEYVREKKWMPLEQAVVKTSALAAKRFRLQGRGTVEVRNFADLVDLRCRKNRLGLRLRPVPARSGRRLPCPGQRPFCCPGWEVDR